MTIRLNGHFHLSDGDGKNRTPVSEKAQALVALVAVAKGQIRTRTWLQDKLWSDRDREHGAGSLRQALSALRKCFSSMPDAFVVTRKSVSINELLVDIHWDKAGQSEFLEGMDISDPEFNVWLSEMRSLSTAKGVFPVINEHPQRYRIALDAEHPEHRPKQELVGRLVDTLGRNINEMRNFELCEKTADDIDITIGITAQHGKDGGVVLRSVATDVHHSRIFWSETLTLADQHDSEQELQIFSYAYRLFSVLSDEVARMTRPATTHLSVMSKQNVLPMIFSFEAMKIKSASQLLSDTLDENLSGSLLGWQAQIEIINIIEQFSDAPEDCIQRGQFFAAKALEAEPMNSIALSTAANAHTLLNWDVQTGADLAELAVRVNPSNPLGWWALSNVALYSGEAEKAMRASKVGQRLARQTPLQFWCDFQFGLAALMQGNLPVAIRAMQTASALSPRFRPPRRYLLALYAQVGEYEKARRVLSSLTKLESVFSLDNLQNDPDYPISLARRSEHIDLASLSAIR